MIKRFSKKQLMALTWWTSRSKHRNLQGIICDGAVRSGKTLSLSLSFVLWSLSCFKGQTFALCGKTIISLKRNVVYPLMALLDEYGFKYSYRAAENRLEVYGGGSTARYYFFGGRDESSAALIQGITLAGGLFDEAALMPESFVNQAMARCSVKGSKLWFNCNPEHPAHWFYRDWILKSNRKNMLYIHFEMKDNPSLSSEILERYKSLYTGVFYERYVLGRWVASLGAVYPMFDRKVHVVSCVPECTRYVISCDYGITNPSSFGLWGIKDGVYYRVREYYCDFKKTGTAKTDEELCDALCALAEGYEIEAVVADPSAASFIASAKKRGFRVLRARNDVIAGIRTVSGLLKNRQMFFHESCEDCIREFSLYRWDSARDYPCKENDHAMDDMRYFANYVSSPGGRFFAGGIER